MGQLAVNLSFRAAFDDGQSLEFRPKAIRPLGLDEIRAVAEGGNPTVTLQFLADNPVLNGETVIGTGTFSARMTFSEPAKIFALVPNGGWHPVPFASPQHFLLDRNVVANFCKLRLRQNFTDRASYEHWTAFFEQGTALLNPLPYAFEGGARRIPSFEEFVQAFEDGAREVGAAYPKSRVGRYSPDQYRAVYGVLLTMHAKTSREITFLCAATPLVRDYAADERLRSIAERILVIADRNSVDRQSLAVLIVLSCLYADPKSPVRGDSIGRRILKPKPGFGQAGAYNAISDLRQIELAAYGHAHIPADARFALCTSDIGVAALWCALGIRDIVETGTGLEYTIDYTTDLFPRLADPEEIANLLAPR